MYHAIPQGSGDASTMGNRPHDTMRAMDKRGLRKELKARRAELEAHAREEMDAAGGQEILMSAVQPAELGQESGRWSAYGPALWRLKDRTGRPCFIPSF